MQAGQIKPIVTQKRIPVRNATYIVNGDWVVVRIQVADHAGERLYLICRVILAVFFGNVPDETVVMSKAGNQLAVIHISIESGPARIVLEDEMQNDPFGLDVLE